MAGWDIVFDRLTAGYGERIILRDITARIPAGKITLIMGSSGCGKSTLLRHITGLSRPVSGKVFLGENDLFSLPAHEFRRLRRHTGMLFQDGALLGALTLAENTALPLSEHSHLPREVLRQAALRTLALVGLESFADYHPHELSGGMRKRAGLARALITEPSVLLCDEPTSGLDPLTATLMDQLLLTTHHQFPETTMVVVSHDLHSLSAIADHVIILYKQQVHFAGTLAELEGTEDPYLRSFLRHGDAAGAEGGGEGGGTVPPHDPAVRAAVQAWRRR